MAFSVTEEIAEWSRLNLMECFVLSMQITAEAILRLATDPVLPFYPLDIALDVQNKLKGQCPLSIDT